MVHFDQFELWPLAGKHPDEVANKKNKRRNGQENWVRVADRPAVAAGRPNNFPHAGKPVVRGCVGKKIETEIAVFSPKVAAFQDLADHQLAELRVCILAPRGARGRKRQITDADAGNDFGKVQHSKLLQKRFKLIPNSRSELRADKDRPIA